MSLAYIVRYNYLCWISDRLEKLHIEMPKAVGKIYSSKDCFHYDLLDKTSFDGSAFVEREIETHNNAGTGKTWYTPLNRKANSARIELTQENIIATCTDYSEKFFDLRK